MAQHLSTANAAHRAQRVAHDAAARPWLTALARAGYAAKGVVYLIIRWSLAEACYRRVGVAP